MQLISKIIFLSRKLNAQEEINTKLDELKKKMCKQKIIDDGAKLDGAQHTSQGETIVGTDDSTNWY